MWLYRLLLHLYPASFRNEYGDEMCAVFRARMRDSSSSVGRMAAAIAACLEIPANAGAVHWDLLRQDLRFTARSLRRAPGFAVTGVLLIALGVGANTATFSVTDYALIRALPFPRPEQLVRVWESPPAYRRMEASPLNYRDWQSMATSFSAMGAYTNLSANLVGKGDPLRIVGASVQPQVLSLIGIAPYAGRLFGADSAAAEVILSYDLWQTRFGGDAQILGERLLLDGSPYVVVGIMPRTFSFPSRETQLWAPLVLTPGAFQDRNDNFLQVVARLREGVSIGAASAEMHAVAHKLEEQYPRENARIDASVFALRDEVSGQSRLMLLTLSGAAACILLLACANLANLLLVRAISRERELSVRTALGAGRERLVRQMVSESVLLAATGGAIGVAIAYAAVPLLARLVPGTLPVAGSPAVDARALVFALALTLITGVGFGLIPALRAGGKDALRGLRDGARSGGGKKETLRATFVVVEVMASVVLLVSSGLLIRAMWHVQSTDPGFRVEGVLTARTSLPLPKYGSVAVREQFYDRVLSGVRALPGVSHAGYISFLPMVMPGGIWPVILPGDAGIRDGGRAASLRYATPDYFATLGIPVVRGRVFESADRQTSPYVAVVSESFAKKYWPDQNPLGKTFSIGLSERTVVGVVGDVRVRGFERTSEPQVYVPSGQVADGSITFYVPKDLVIRTSGNPEALVAAVERVVHAADPEQPVSNVQTMDDVIASQTATRSVQARVLGLLALLAFVIAGVGIHGLLAFSVSQRSREFGVRLALGAHPGEIVTMVLRRGAVLAMAGVIPGLAVAYAAGKAMQSLLVGVSPGDATTFLISGGLCVVMALLGCLPPAIRAMRVDPLTVIRAE